MAEGRAGVCDRVGFVTSLSVALGSFRAVGGAGCVTVRNIAREAVTEGELLNLCHYLVTADRALFALRQTVLRAGWGDSLKSFRRMRGRGQLHIIDCFIGATGTCCCNLRKSLCRAGCRCNGFIFNLKIVSERFNSFALFAVAANGASFARFVARLSAGCFLCRECLKRAGACLLISAVDADF